MFGRLTDPDPPPSDGPASAGPASAGPASAGPPPGGPPSVPPPLPPVLPAPELQATADPSPEPQATPIATAQTTAAKPCQPEPMPLLPSRPLRSRGRASVPTGKLEKTWEIPFSPVGTWPESSGTRSTVVAERGANRWASAQAPGCCLHERSHPRCARDVRAAGGGDAVEQVDGRAGGGTVRLRHPRDAGGRWFR